MNDRIKKIKFLTWIKLVSGILLVAGLLVGIRLTPARQFLSIDYIIQWVETMRLSYWNCLLFYVVFAFAVLAVPLSIFPIVGGVLLPFWIALPLNLLATTLGASLAFWIARFFGREAVELMLRGKLKAADRLAAIQGFKTVVLIRWIGIPPFLLANYAMGLSRVRLRDYVLGTVIGILPWTVIVTYTANSLWLAVLEKDERGLLRAALIRMIPLLVLSLTMLSSWVFSHYWKKRKRLQAGPS